MTEKPRRTLHARAEAEALACSLTATRTHAGQCPLGEHVEVDAHKRASRRVVDMKGPIFYSERPELPALPRNFHSFKSEHSAEHAALLGVLHCWVESPSQSTGSAVEASTVLYGVLGRGAFNARHPRARAVEIN